MQIEPSGIASVELIGPAHPGFGRIVSRLLDHEPGEILTPALPFSVVVRNASHLAIALLGVRFDMTGAAGKSFSVVHYADTLRNPRTAALTAGSLRFVCAEQIYTDFVLRRLNEVDPRGPMSLERLRRAPVRRASIDCVAFHDGQFAGPDSLGAFERFAREREAEAALTRGLIEGGGSFGDAITGSEARGLARRLRIAYELGGIAEARAQARAHRLRIPLWR